MNKIMAIIVMLIILAGCSSQTVVPSPTEPSEEEAYYLNDELSEQEKKYLNGTKFVMPIVECEFKDDMVSYLESFSYEFLFPEFSEISKLPFSDSSVSSNLFSLISSSNDELLQNGLGVSDDVRKFYADKLGKEVYEMSIASVDDMNFIGRKYFGSEFAFPRGVACREIGPFELDDSFYTWTGGRGFMQPYQYMVTDVAEQNDTIIATFLPYKIFNSWDDGSVVGIGFLCNSSENSDENYLDYYGNFGLSDSETNYLQMEADSKGSPLDYCNLIVPQNSLGTITVAFQKQNNNTLTALSCVYNRNN